MKTIVVNDNIFRDGQYDVILNLDGSYELCFKNPYGDLLDNVNVVDSVWIGDPTFSTYRFRQYCDDLHPEIDFDKEFDTSEPGVFGRFQDKFDDDYEEWISNKILSELEEKLKIKGYVLAF